MDSFRWIPDGGLEAAAEALEEEIDEEARDENAKKKTKKKKKKTKGGKKRGDRGGATNQWVREWEDGWRSKNWKGYGSDVYYQPRSRWPPLPRDARKRAKERNENATNDPDRFRPWDGDTLPWQPPASAFNAPMRDLTLINQPPWRHNSPSGGAHHASSPFSRTPAPHV